MVRLVVSLEPGRMWPVKVVKRQEQEAVGAVVGPTKTWTESRRPEMHAGDWKCLH